MSSPREVFKLSGRALEAAKQVYAQTEVAQKALAAMQKRHHEEQAEYQQRAHAGIKKLIAALLEEVGMTAHADRMETLDLQYLEHSGDAYLTFHPESSSEEPDGPSEQTLQ